MKRSLIFLAMLTLLVIGCSQQQQLPEQPAAQEMPAQDAPETKETAVEITPVETPAVPSAELLSEVACTDGVVKLTLTNVGSTEVAVSDIKFRLNAALDNTPGCEAEKLAAGEATACTSINVVRASRGSIVQVELPTGEDDLVKPNCA